VCWVVLYGGVARGAEIRESGRPPTPTVWQGSTFGRRGVDRKGAASSLIVMGSGAGVERENQKGRGINGVGWGGGGDIFGWGVFTGWGEGRLQVPVGGVVRQR